MLLFIPFLGRMWEQTFSEQAYSSQQSAGPWVTSKMFLWGMKRSVKKAAAAPPPQEAGEQENPPEEKGVLKALV